MSLLVSLTILIGFLGTAHIFAQTTNAYAQAPPPPPDQILSFKSIYHNFKVHVGDRILVVNDDAIPHGIVGQYQDGTYRIDSGYIQPGSSTKLNFSPGGNFTFHDEGSLQFQNVGSILVVDSSIAIPPLPQAQVTFPPVILVPQNQVVQTINQNGAVVFYPFVTATDFRDIPVTPICSTPQGTTLPIGITTVTCTATDYVGNVGKASFTVTVQFYNAPNNITKEIDIAQGAGASGTAACVAANNCFIPNPLYVAPGTTVVWKNTDVMSHAITSGKAGDSNSGSLFTTGSMTGCGCIEPGVTYQFIFANIGTFDYYDPLHFWMTGQVVVGSGNQSSPTQPIPPPSLQQQIQTTSGGTLKVGFSTDPINPDTSSQTQLKINFINKQTNELQPHVDYKVSVNQGSIKVFGVPTRTDAGQPTIPFQFHTTGGSVTIPFQFQTAGTYQIMVEVDGLVFQPIPPEIATFSIPVTGQTTYTLPSSPTNLVATPISSSEVDLSWTAPQNNGGLQITGYKIERNDGNGFNVIANSPTTSYQDKNLVPNPEHSYRVSAINSAGSSVPSNIAPVMMPSSPTPTPTQSNTQNTTTSSDQNSNQSLSDILKQRYEAARKLQEMLNGQTGTNIAIPQGAGASASADCVTTNNCFSPNPLNVAPGTTVTWTNNDQVSHTITSGKVSDSNAGSLFDSGLVKPGNTFQFTFATAGTVNYFCTVHPWMIGQVIVGGMEGHHEYENESQQIQHEREHNNYGIINPTQQDIQNINQAKPIKQ